MQPAPLPCVQALVHHTDMQARTHDMPACTDVPAASTQTRQAASTHFSGHRCAARMPAGTYECASTPPQRGPMCKMAWMTGERCGNDEHAGMVEGASEAYVCGVRYMDEGAVIQAR